MTITKEVEAMARSAMFSGYPGDPAFEFEDVRREAMAGCCSDGMCEARVRPCLHPTCPLQQLWRWFAAIRAARG